MSHVDLVFEGGGAKGMLFAGALEVLFNEHGHSPARLLGTSAGAITAVTLAAGYTAEEMLVALTEKDAAGKPVFASFLGSPAPFDDEAIRHSAIRQLLAQLDLPFVSGFVEDQIDDWIAHELATNEAARHLFSFIERGGWFSADPFVAWLERRLDAPRLDGTPRSFSKLTMQEFFDATGVELTLVAADTTALRMLLLNHRTAPDCPVVWAARMSMSVPLLWQEVEWQPGWGAYYAWNPATQSLEPNDVAGHAIVDGGLLSNFPIALLLADRPDVTAIVGPAAASNVLGLLIDESLPVPNRPPRPEPAGWLALGSLRTVRRLRSLINTATSAHDNMAIAAFARHVVRLPAGGYSTTQFDMTDEERQVLVNAGRQAMRAFLQQQTVLAVPMSIPGGAPGADITALANQAALGILQR